MDSIWWRFFGCLTYSNYTTLQSYHIRGGWQ